MATSEFSTLKLYRDALRLADYLSRKQGNRAVLRDQVRQAFRTNMDETDPQKIEAMRKSAIQGLSNYMFYEAQRMVKDGEVGKEAPSGTQR
mmetsp:Transcript_2449/g.7071  ORF Transcript_2449/g.7071 Transcript_2449/m.7071 type:complete len:91 (+) Transcript_2449:138-410(+)